MKLFESITIFFIVLIGCSILWTATEGGSIWTAESARRANILEMPLSMPNKIKIEMHNSQVKELANPKTNIVLIDFIYTSCPTVCVAMGAEFKRLQYELFNHPNYNNLSFLSISFDDSDKTENLNEYLERFKADKTKWQAAKFTSQIQKKKILELLEVVVLPDKQGGFIHNSAIYVQKNDAIVEILDFGNFNQTKQKVITYLESVS